MCTFREAVLSVFHALTKHLRQRGLYAVVVLSLFTLSFKAFEDSIRKNRSVVSNWLKYGQWEESQREIER